MKWNGMEKTHLCSTEERKSQVWHGCEWQILSYHLVTLHAGASLLGSSSLQNPPHTYPGETEAHADGGVDSHTVITLLSLDVNGVLSGGTHRRWYLHQKSQHANHIQRRHYSWQVIRMSVSGIWRTTVNIMRNLHKKSQI